MLIAQCPLLPLLPSLHPSIRTSVHPPIRLLCTSTARSHASILFTVTVTPNTRLHMYSILSSEQLLLLPAVIYFIPPALGRGQISSSKQTSANGSSAPSQIRATTNCSHCMHIIAIGSTVPHVFPLPASTRHAMACFFLLLFSSFFFFVSSPYSPLYLLPFPFPFPFPFLVLFLVMVMVLVLVLVLVPVPFQTPPALGARPQPRPPQKMKPMKPLVHMHIL